MTLYVRTDYVPEGCDYLTVGKLYEVTDLSHAGDSGNTLCDDDAEIFILLGDKCAHIGKEWEQVTFPDNIYFIPKANVVLVGGHVHAELMLEYGKHALTTKEPWLDYESQPNHQDSKIWHQCNGQLLFAPDTRYRRKPKTILINGYEVPEPLRAAPEEGTVIYTIDVDSTELVSCPFNFLPTQTVQLRWLARGILHSTKEAAQLHAKALLSFTTTVQEQL